MPYKITLHTKAGVVCVIHMFRAKYVCVLFLWGGIHLRLLATCDVAVVTRDVG